MEEKVLERCYLGSNSVSEPREPDAHINTKSSGISRLVYKAPFVLTQFRHSYTLAATFSGRAASAPYFASMLEP